MDALFDQQENGGESKVKILGPSSCLQNRVYNPRNVSVLIVSFCL